MGTIALVIAIISFSILWSSDQEFLKWSILGAGLLSVYIRTVVNSIARGSSRISIEFMIFWMHGANISFWISIILSIVGIFSVFSQDEISAQDDRLNIDVVGIVELIRKSSEPQIYANEIQEGIKFYSNKLSSYSEKDINYLLYVCKLPIDLELTAFDGMIESYEKYGTTVRYYPKNDLRVKKIKDEIISYGIKPLQEADIPSAVTLFDQLGSSTPKPQFMKMLREIRMMMSSDYLKVYDDIFYNINIK